jgi:hypothetical protein
MFKNSPHACAGVALSMLFAFQGASAVDFEYSSKLSGELRYFPDTPQFQGQLSHSNISLALSPELLWQWNESQDLLVFSPFFRIDQHDEERTHADIRELSWEHYANEWELRGGLRKVFWGVTEFQHLADVINQDDGLESLSGDEKLGQPMVNLSMVKDWGIVDLYLLPGFRERAYPGEEGRFRSGLGIDTDRVQYESVDEERHIDFAARWSHTLGDYDIGFYGFKGTNRQPQLKLDQQSGKAVLLPFYEQMTQFGVDLQATLDNWLWKGELIMRDTKNETYSASQLGFEYSFYGVQGSNKDLGLLLEYGWDERGKQASSLFQNDVSLGVRLAFNDEASSEILSGIVHDLDYGSTSFRVEYSSRIAEQLKLSLEGQIFSLSKQDDQVISALEKDSNVQMTLDWYF